MLRPFFSVYVEYFKRICSFEGFTKIYILSIIHFREAYFFMGAVMFLGCPVVLMTPLAERKFEKSEKEDAESEKFVK